MTYDETPTSSSQRNAPFLIFFYIAFLFKVTRQTSSQTENRTVCVHVHKTSFESLLATTQYTTLPAQINNTHPTVT